ncbi:MAG: cobalamin biosynthesis protein CobD [SAR324 cluster bacterium]|nr:cobalamin biosynthesis protein CobD [SAR324 cluster bacterium]
MELSLLFGGMAGWGFLVIVLSLDQVFGDPNYPLHPIRLIGKLLSFYETKLRFREADGFWGGVVLFFLLAFSTLIPILIINNLLEKIHPWLAQLWQLYIAYSMFALKDLSLHAQRVCEATEQGNLEAARHYSSMMVGRDTEKMDAHACNRAAIESVSENLTDGVISPLFYLLLFGVPGMVIFKIVSTMDSMVGYKTPKYIKFGSFGARFDDVLNWIPARLTWLLIVLVSLFHPNYSARKAWDIGLSQHALVPGPNSGWSETGAAGALSVQLVGPIWRNGNLDVNLWLGHPDDPQQLNANDVTRMNQLAAWVSFAFICLAFILT